MVSLCVYFFYYFSPRGKDFTNPNIKRTTLYVISHQFNFKLFP